MKRFIRHAIGETTGQDMVEYALLAAIVAIGSVAALSAFSSIITTAWTSISSMLAN